MQVTITEALADIKTSQARILKKQEAWKRYFIRQRKLVDPLEGQGGSEEFVRRQQQGILDLHERLVTLRTRIQEANLTNTIEVGGVKRSVAAWLTWEREVAGKYREFLGYLASGIAQTRNGGGTGRERMTGALNIQQNTGAGESPDWVVAMPEADLSKQLEGMETILGTLDGRLQLFNATCVIDVEEAPTD